VKSRKIGVHTLQGDTVTSHQSGFIIFRGQGCRLQDDSLGNSRLTKQTDNVNNRFNFINQYELLLFKSQNLDDRLNGYYEEKALEYIKLAANCGNKKAIDILNELSILRKNRQKPVEILQMEWARDTNKFTGSQFSPNDALELQRRVRDMIDPLKNGWKKKVTYL
jgi:hypothetical protein